MHGETWDVDECTACSCDNGTITCVTEGCQPAFCISPVKPEGECCLLCPYNVVVKKVRPEITNGDTFTEEGDNQISVNVSIKFHDATDTTGVSGEDLWKLSAWASANPDGNGPRIGFEEDILDLKQKDQDLKRTEKIEFTNLDFSFSDPMAECVDTKYICVRIERGDDPRTTGYIGYSLGGYPGPNAQTGCTRAPECRRSQAQESSLSVSISSDDNLLQCFYRGIPYMDSESWDVDECTTCSCDNGMATCVIESCQPASCTSPVKPDGECCYVCPYSMYTQESSFSVSSSEGLLPCEYRGVPYVDSQTWDVDECTTCSCDNGTVTCVIVSCQPAFCTSPGKPEGYCCVLCPYNVVVKKVRPEITNGDTFTEEGDNQISVNVSIKFHDATDTTGVSGEDLWKLSAWASANPDGNGPRIGFEEDILDLKQKDQSLTRREKIEFTNLDFSFSDPMAECVDMKYICVRIERGDNPRTTGYIGYTLGGYPGPSAQTGCTRAPECRRSQALTDVVVKKVRPEITNGDTSTEEGDNQISINVSIKFHDATDTTGVSGEDLWKLSAWASANPDGNGPRIGFEEDILDLKQKDQSLKRRERIEFTNLDFSFSDPMAKCVDMKYICVRIERGDNPRTTGYIGYTLGGYPGPSAQTGCTRAPECRRSQDVVVKKVRPKITNGDNFTEEGDNQISVNVSIKFHDATDTTGVSGEDLWKLSAWASANPDGNGPRIGFEEDILDLKQKDQSLKRRERIEFTNLDFSFSDPMAKCVDMKYICVRIERGDNPRTTGYIGYTLGGYPGPNAQTGCTRAPECRRSQGTNLFRSLLSKAFQHTRK
ncbi:uncharacterized protein LOC121421111 isoform X1 [Lytechinus variegatus]|uniref:uncharacterized protein LOC121421111 isoform X1 n=1 Tax=Lytechinus variegatus TaxID=7654 RepID=UPI001BB26B8B|nr:uncharacterized protein LOC121421111 isoform X1 [Lytechinus variegatus]